MKLDNDLPTSRNHLVWATVILVLFIVVVYFFDYLFLNSSSKDEENLHVLIIKSISENVIAGAFAALALALIYRFVVRFVEPGDRVIEVSPGGISDRLLENARRSGNYTFIGNTATFVTASILPILCARAQKNGRTIASRIFIIDPRDDVVIASYVRHKNRVAVARSRIADADLAAWTRPASDAKSETTSTAIAKIFACMYLCAYASRCSGVDINVYLRKSFTPFRADVSDNEAILTQESAAEAAVAFSSRGHFHGWYGKEAEALEQQCTKVDFTNAPNLDCISLAHPSSSKDNIQKSFKCLFFDVLKDLNFNISEDVECMAIERIMRPTHSYIS